MTWYEIKMVACYVENDNQEASEEAIELCLEESQNLKSQKESQKYK